MTPSPSFRHLLRRAVTSLSNSDPCDEDVAVVADVLLPGEASFWTRLQGRDKRHSLEVLARFDGLCPSATRSERAAALLHDVGKIESDLGWMGRIVATLVGARTVRMRLYLEHECLGARLLTGISDPRTVMLVSGRGDDDVSRALRRADDV